MSSTAIIVIVAIVLTIILYAISKSYNFQSYDVQVELKRIDNMDGTAFEDWCAKLLESSGYRNVKTTKATEEYSLCTPLCFEVCCLCVWMIPQSKTCKDRIDFDTEIRKDEEDFYEKNRLFPDCVPAVREHDP